MAEHATTDGLGLSSLFRAIFGDVRGLIRDEVRLAKAELLKEWGKAKTAAAAMAGGAVVLGVGGLLLCLAAVSALHEAARLPWWAAFLAVGGAFTLLGAGLLYAGRRKASQVHVIPTQAARALGQDHKPDSQPAPEAPQPPPAPQTGPTTGTTAGLLGIALLAGVALEGFLGRRAAQSNPEAAAAAGAPPARVDAEASGGGGFVEKLSDQLGAELDKLQDQAIAAIVTLVREVAQKSITALAELVEAKVSAAAARLAAAAPPQADGGQPDAPGEPPPAP